MLAENEIQVSFEGMEVERDFTYARFEGNFTEDPFALIRANKAIKAKFGPTFLSARKDIKEIGTPDDLIKRPILVWDAIWMHNQTPQRPVMFEPQEERAPSFPLKDFIQIA